MTKFKKGDLVYIINRKMNGQYIVEGKAKILRPIDAAENYYDVQFTSEPDDDEGYPRFVIPDAQISPQKWCSDMNNLIR